MGAVVRRSHPAGAKGGPLSGLSLNCELASNRLDPDRASGVFLARLLIVYRTDSPEVLRRSANEPKGLAEVESEEVPQESGAARPTRGYLWGYVA